MTHEEFRAREAKHRDAFLAKEKVLCDKIGELEMKLAAMQADYAVKLADIDVGDKVRWDDNGRYSTGIVTEVLLSGGGKPVYIVRKYNINGNLGRNLNKIHLTLDNVTLIAKKEDL